MENKNIVRKGEIACYKQFLLFSQCFPQLYILHQNAAVCPNGLTGAQESKLYHCGWLTAKEIRTRFLFQNQSVENAGVAFKGANERFEFFEEINKQ